MDAQTTQIVGQVLTGIGTVVLSGAFTFVAYEAKKHMGSIVAWIDSKIGTDNFNKLVTLIQGFVQEAEKQGLIKGLSGDEQFQYVLNKIKSEQSALLAKTGIDGATLEALIEKEWGAMKEQLQKDYEDATKTQAQKDLEDAKAKQAAADKAKQDAEATKAAAQTQLAQAQAVQAKVQSVLTAVNVVPTATDTKADASVTVTAKQPETTAEAPQSVKVQPVTEVHEAQKEDGTKVDVPATPSVPKPEEPAKPVTSAPTEEAKK